MYIYIYIYIYIYTYLPTYMRYRISHVTYHISDIRYHIPGGCPKHCGYRISTNEKRNNGGKLRFTHFLYVNSRDFETNLGVVSG